MPCLPDNAGRVLQPSAANTYDVLGNLATATDAGGTTAYGYNKLNLVDQITEPGGRTDVFAYDASSAYDANGNLAEASAAEFLKKH